MTSSRQTVPDFQETRPRNYILSASASAVSAPPRPPGLPAPAPPARGSHTAQQQEHRACPESREDWRAAALPRAPCLPPCAHGAGLASLCALLEAEAGPAAPDGTGSCGAADPSPPPPRPRRGPEVCPLPPHRPRRPSMGSQTQDWRRGWCRSASLTRCRGGEERPRERAGRVGGPEGGGRRAEDRRKEVGRVGSRRVPLSWDLFFTASSGYYVFTCSLEHGPPTSVPSYLWPPQVAVPLLPFSPTFHFCPGRHAVAQTPWLSFTSVPACCRECLCTHAVAGPSFPWGGGPGSLHQAPLAGCPLYTRVGAAPHVLVFSVALWRDTSVHRANLVLLSGYHLRIDLPHWAGEMGLLSRGGGRGVFLL